MSFFLRTHRLNFEIRRFLNKQMRFGQVLVVEARQYGINGATFIVPVLIGYTDRIRMEKKTVTVNPVSPGPVLTRETLLALVREKDSGAARLAEQMIDKLASLALKAKEFSSQISYGVEVGGDFISIVSLTPSGIWFTPPNRIANALDKSKKNINETWQLLYRGRSL